MEHVSKHRAGPSTTGGPTIPCHKDKQRLKILTVGEDTCHAPWVGYRVVSQEPQKYRCIASFLECALSAATVLGTQGARLPALQSGP